MCPSDLVKELLIDTCRSVRQLRRKGHPQYQAKHPFILRLLHETPKEVWRAVSAVRTSWVCIHPHCPREYLAE